MTENHGLTQTEKILANTYATINIAIIQTIKTILLITYNLLTLIAR